MKPLKSSLNPHAVPFVPSYLKMFAIDFGKDIKFDNVASAGSVDNEGTAILQDINSLESDVHNQDLCFSGEMSSGDAHVASNTHTVSTSEGIIETGNQNLEEDFNAVAELLSAEFPNISSESLAELFYMNNGDLEETLNMLEQLEGPVSDTYIPDTSDEKYVEAKCMEVGESSCSADLN